MHLYIHITYFYFSSFITCIHINKHYAYTETCTERDFFTQYIILLMENLHVRWKTLQITITRKWPATHRGSIKSKKLKMPYTYTFIYAYICRYISYVPACLHTYIKIEAHTSGCLLRNAPMEFTCMY